MMERVKHVKQNSKKLWKEKFFTSLWYAIFSLLLFPSLTAFFWFLFTFSLASYSQPNSYLLPFNFFLFSPNIESFTCSSNEYLNFQNFYTLVFLFFKKTFQLYFASFRLLLIHLDFVQFNAFFLLSSNFIFSSITMEKV